MRRPLELVVHHRSKTDPNRFVVKGFWEWRPYDTSKRLTDPELAAEVWRARWTVKIAKLEWPFILTEANLEKVRTIERFATHPHYDEGLT